MTTQFFMEGIDVPAEPPKRREITPRPVVSKENKSQLGLQIAMARVKLKMSPSEFARDLGISPEILHQIEVGQYYPPLHVLAELMHRNIIK